MASISPASDSIRRRISGYSGSFSPSFKMNENKKCAGAAGFKGGGSEALLKGNEALSGNNFEEALKWFHKAKDAEPDNKEIYKKLAKAQYGLKEYGSAEENYKRYLKENPDDFDIIIELGRTQRALGLYNDALNTFKKAEKLDNANDLAKRCILETENYKLSIFSPARAEAEKAQYALKNLELAVKLASNYMTPEYMSEIGDTEIKFGRTASMGGTENIAQYENAKNSITVSNSYIYAAPQVIAAYLSHEAVHAHDHDPYTSVAEEQDAYEIAAKFWIKNSKGVKDPEMDYAAELYKKSPDALKKRVKEIYMLRDPSIAMTSPNHPPERLFHLGRKKTNAAASGALKHYDIIA